MRGLKRGTRNDALDPPPPPPANSLNVAIADAVWVFVNHPHVGFSAEALVWILYAEPPPTFTPPLKSKIFAVNPLSNPSELDASTTTDVMNTSLSSAGVILPGWIEVADPELPPALS